MALNGGAFQALRRLASSASVTSTVMRFCLGVERDLVAVLHQGDRAADLGFGRDVADDEAVAAAGEAAVGDEGDVGAEAGAHDGAGGGEHLGHAGAALRAFVADDDDVALVDFLLLEGVEHVLFAVEAVGRAGEDEAFLAGDLGDGAVGAEVAAHDADVAGGFERLVERVDDLLARL